MQAVLVVFIFRSFECFAAILDSLQTGRIGARMTDCRRGWGAGKENSPLFFYFKMAA